MTITLFFPYLTNGALFFRVIVAPAVEAFVFYYEIATIYQFADEIRIEAICGGLKPEGMLRATFEITNPAFDFGMVIEQLGALEFFALGFYITNDFIVVLLESVPPFKQGVGRIGILFRVKGETQIRRCNQLVFRCGE